MLDSTMKQLFIGAFMLTSTISLSQQTYNLSVAINQSNCPLSVDNPGEMLVYPNPASEFVYVLPDHKTLSIIDVSGKHYAIDMLSEGLLNISHLPSGIFFIHLSNGGKVISTKLKIRR